ncbi:type II toxin-antitoxin system VapC family toxin [Bradyrhizobium sp. SBR1B]|uniref:type II toxin-antitoxin system VapC family toxin n=1 Tax=Bradyrhizobium sp. SBR1B TaxID=2663836 RepID=UPI0017A383A8|nr:type II toxin-antitoxin system VapC family toxin [Bradyrhizobium sp. SBR1B]MBB4383031.1 hypothetical protein [Bradyrhizobium sp. SBR1B]
MPSARELNLPIAAAAEAVESYLALIEIKMVNVAPETARIALEAYNRYGKGRHPHGSILATVSPSLRPPSRRTGDVQGRRLSRRLTSATIEAGLSVAEVMNVDSRGPPNLRWEASPIAVTTVDLTYEDV